jgi:protein-S-isoprenylcysteine O-methyltransferase Ste14
VQRWGFSWQGWLTNRRGEWWLLAQLLVIAAHCLPPTPSPLSLGVLWPAWLRVLGGLVLALGLWRAALSARGLGGSLTPLPCPMDGAPLIIEGPYRHCRHPLYQAVLLCSLGVVVLLGSLLHLALLVLLAVVLVQKAHREEAHLCALHEGYGAYRQTTVAIVPGLPGLDWRGP